MMHFIIASMQKIEPAFKEHLQKINRELKNTFKD
jgi:hypothetical protein